MKPYNTIIDTIVEQNSLRKRLPHPRQTLDSKKTIFLV